MKICLLAEGCYPYVAGGVSSWMQMLVAGMPEHEFEVFAIGAEKKQRGQYKYTLPENITAVHEYFLDEFFHEGNLAKRVHITSETKQAFIDLLIGNPVDWDAVFEQFGEHGDFAVNDFLCSEAFMDIVMEVGNMPRYQHTPFTEVFWTIRSMMLPMLNLLRCDIPEADIYHSVSTGYAGLVASVFRYRTGKPFVLTEHGIYSREREEEILKATWVNTFFKQTWIDFFEAMCLSAYTHADKVISLFHGARDIQIHLGAPEEKCSVIPNGINMARFSAVPLISEEPHPLTIGAVIRVVPIKDIKTMIQAFALLRLKRPDAHLYMIGPTDESEEYYEECLDLVKNLGCEEGIDFVGRVNVVEWLPKIDIVILTSISEGQPFVLLEAMAAHRPVLATNVGSCKELIEGYEDPYGPAGVVVPVMNPPKVAEGILEICKDTATMRSFAENGYARVSSLYQDKDFLDRYRMVYQDASQHCSEGRRWG